TCDLQDRFPDGDDARRDGATRSCRPRGDEAAARGGRVVARGGGVAALHIPYGDRDGLPFFIRSLRRLLAGLKHFLT
ncbi:unnamed protein product, partial [Urochloa humidicola]